MKKTKAALDFGQIRQALDQLEKNLREGIEHDSQQMASDFHHRLRARCATVVGCIDVWEMCADEAERAVLLAGLRAAAGDMLAFLDERIGDAEIW